MIVKVCGMREPGNIRDVEQTGADLMGFIFHPKSPRYVAARPAYLPKAQRRVGVFVNAPMEEILRKAREYSLDYIQLHGSESPEFCRQLKAAGLRVIRAIGVSSPADAERAAIYDMADLMLFDTKTPQHGGSGRRFNWDALAAYGGRVPFLLSGGINPQSAGDILALTHPMMAGIDINSGFETAPAVKDAEAIRLFIQKIKGEKPQQSQQ